MKSVRAYPTLRKDLQTRVAKRLFSVLQLSITTTLLSVFPVISAIPKAAASNSKTKSRVKKSLFHRLRK